MLDLADKAVETVKSAVSSEEPEAEEPAPEVEEEAEPEPETKEIVVRRQWGLRDYRMAFSSAGVFGTAGASSLSFARASSEQISPLPLCSAQLQTAPVDFRFPIQNQSRHCYVAVRRWSFGCGWTVHPLGMGPAATDHPDT